MIKAEGRTIRCAIHKLIISIWNKEELLEEWKELIIVPIHKKGDKTDCNNYSGISILPTTYKILSNILLSRLIRYPEEVTGDHQCGFRRNNNNITGVVLKYTPYNSAVLIVTVYLLLLLYHFLITPYSNNVKLQRNTISHSMPDNVH